MCFWTWAKGLEDSFDSKNRQNLKDFISASANGLPISSTTDADIASDTAHASALYYINHVSPNTSSPSLDDSSDEKVAGQKYHAEETMELLRIPTCAVFHKLTPGQGVPHSFVGFVKQYPALPRVVVGFLSFSASVSDCANSIILRRFSCLFECFLWPVFRESQGTKLLKSDHYKVYSWILTLSTSFADSLLSK